MAETLPISKAERAGLVEMRQLRRDNQKRGDEHILLAWMWHGRTLKAVKIMDFSRLINVEE